MLNNMTVELNLHLSHGLSVVTNEQLEPENCLELDSNK